MIRTFTVLALDSQVPKAIILLAETWFNSGYVLAVDSPVLVPTVAVWDNQTIIDPMVITIIIIQFIYCAPIPE